MIFVMGALPALTLHHTELSTFDNRSSLQAMLPRHDVSSEDLPLFMGAELIRLPETD